MKQVKILITESIQRYLNLEQKLFQEQGSWIETQEILQCLLNSVCRSLAPEPVKEKKEPLPKQPKRIKISFCGYEISFNKAYKKIYINSDTMKIKIDKEVFDKLGEVELKRLIKEEELK